MEANMANLLSLIKCYLNLGLRHWNTVLSLSQIDGIAISLSTLRRHQRTLRLFRKKKLIHSHVSPGSVGLIWHAPQDDASELHSGYMVTQATIKRLLKILDPLGVQLRHLRSSTSHY